MPDCLVQIAALISILSAGFQPLHLIVCFQQSRRASLSTLSYQDPALLTTVQQLPFSVRGKARSIRMNPCTICPHPCDLSGLVFRNPLQCSFHCSVTSLLALPQTGHSPVSGPWHLLNMPITMSDSGTNFSGCVLGGGGGFSHKFSNSSTEARCYTIELNFDTIHNGKESTCQCRRCRRHGFSPWVGKIP